MLRLAQERGLQAAVKERLLRAYMTEGEAIGDRETLARLGGEVGLDAEAVRRALTSGAFAAEVRADEAEAQRLGIHAVPFFVLADRYGVAGAQPVEVLHQALRQAWEEPREAVAEGAACGPDGCG